MHGQGRANYADELNLGYLAIQIAQDLTHAVCRIGCPIYMRG